MIESNKYMNDKTKHVRILMTSFEKEKIVLLKTKKKLRKNNIQKVMILDGLRKGEICNVDRTYIYSKNKNKHFKD